MSGNSKLSRIEGVKEQMRFPPQSIASSCWWRSEIYETAPIFLLELGDDFAFLGRQRRLRIDNTWFRTDLVFFRRRLGGV